MTKARGYTGLTIYTVTHKVSVVVVDGVTVGHPCCAVYNCHAPLSNNHHRFCPTHSGQNNQCAIISCNLPVVHGRLTCATLEHRQVEDTHELRGQSRFQLQERLTRARATIATNTPLAEDPPDEEEYEFDENTRRVLPATAQSTRKKFKAVFGRRRTHNEQLIVAPCGMIIARRTFFGAEGVASVKVSIIVTRRRPFPQLGIVYSNSLKRSMRARTLSSLTIYFSTTTALSPNLPRATLSLTTLACPSTFFILNASTRRPTNSVRRIATQKHSLSSITMMGRVGGSIPLWQNKRTIGLASITPSLAKC